MTVEQPEPSFPAAEFPRRWARLAAFVAPRLQAGEGVRAILSKTGKPHPLIDILAGLVSLDSLADDSATHRAIVVTDRQVFIVRMPWLGAWSIEQVSDLDAVAVAAFTTGSLPAAGLLHTPGNVRLRFSGHRHMDFSFGVGGAEQSLLRAEAEAVVKALATPAMSGDVPAS